MTKKLAMAVAALALALPGTGSAQVKIGFINSITGPEAPIGENLTNGVDMAVEDLKKQGVNVTLVKQDDTGKPQVAMSAMEQLATGDEVAAVVGPYTSATANAVAKLAQQYKVPQVVPAAAKEEITKQGYDWVFRLNAPAHQYAQSLIDAALTFGKPKSIAFIYESTDFGASVAGAGKDYAQKKGLKIVADEAYQKGAPDYRSTLTKIKAQNPDLVFMVSYVADAILLMRQSREVGLKPQAFLGGGAGFDTAQFEGEKDISNLVFSVTQWTPESSKAATAFADRYKAKYGKKPTYHAACAYAAMMVVGETAAKNGGDRKKIRDALANGSWTGIMGKVDFETYEGFTNQNKLVMPVIQYQGGKSETVFPKEAAQKKAVYPFPGWK
ncbi:ABC transporter substrate-binding protein [Anaeromyxobacter dehalogenans]|uniref:Amino acid/amide ABC transporter substrate-binding protein, HAAT family n=1 Tax=Anaeromyxobacter dehalogenans (strain 2CP-C) TaxID=290397 RepID=Q2IKL6_ANADE|nr:ABC transporter substrate-binding protein [Anaeromyxobacter dehalogenans]ABC82194.1 amino acid/amide ABC transporter substrate-binding protein, HAAT family [Anaeromyxobacter dehalogenans 2CP-C]